jgi:hypothetical protein
MSNPEGEVSIALVCEARADAQIAADLADRVLFETFPSLEQVLEHHRRFRGLAPSDPYLKWSEQKTLVRRLGIPRFHGHFNGQAAEPDALATFRMLLILDQAEHRPDAVFLIRDTDNDKRRQRGLEQARADYPWAFTIVIGAAHTKSECWVMAGFKPENREEKDRLEALRQELGFNPCAAAELLTAQSDSAKKSAKRVLSHLTQGDQFRERKCWTITPLVELKQNGQASGLAEYITELTTRLAPLFEHRAV